MWCSVLQQTQAPDLYYDTCMHVYSPRLHVIAHVQDSPRNGKLSAGWLEGI